jgi:hypothetical protein
VLKPFGAKEVTRMVNVRVPHDHNQLKELTVVVMDGASAPVDAAPPDSLENYLNAIERQRRGTDLVVLVPTQSQGMQYRGQLLRNMPASARNVLNDNSATDVAATADVEYLVLPTDWVLSGTAVVRAAVKEDPSWERKD